MHGRWYNDACGAAFALELVGERWALLVMRELMLGACRFSRLRGQLPGISAKVLTERLDWLETAGVVRRRTLPPPAGVQVYELTEWGLAAEPVMQELGRWAVRSPFHNPGLPLSPVSFMLSLRTMIDGEAAKTLRTAVRFTIGEAAYWADLVDGDLAICRAGDDDRAAELVFAAPDPVPLLRVFYGKEPLDAVAGEGGLRVEGDLALARRFADLFALPPKCGETAVRDSQ